MNIKLIKYSTVDNSIIMITDVEPETILITDAKGTVFNVEEYDTVQRSINWITTFYASEYTLISDPVSNADLSKVSIVTVASGEEVSSSVAMYDELIFASTKLDMLNAITQNKENKEFYKYLVKFSFLESGMNDIAKHTANLVDCMAFYNEMVAIKNNFKAKYHYNDRL